MHLLSRTRIGTITLLLAFALLGGLFFMHDALAATGSIYLTPSGSSVQKGNTLTVSIRVNPGTTIDSVQGALNFDSGKLQVVSVNTGGSAFSSELQNTQGGSSVGFARGDFGAGVSGDALIESVTFKALAGSGSTSLSLSGANADAGGTFTNPAVGGATIGFTTPPASCPAGQTGTPPNCVTPTSGGSSGGGVTGKSGGSSTSNTGSTTSGTSGVSGGASAGGSTGSSTSGGASGGTPVTISQPAVQYSRADLSFTSKTPTKVYVRFGIDGLLTTNTPVSDFATAHTISIDPSLLVPGERYSYVVVSTDQQGRVVQSAVQHFATKGLKVTFGVFDSKHQPLKGRTVTLHSTPQTAKTDDSGFVTFTNVSPGTHHVIYTAGKHTYDQPVSVANTVQTAGATQTADPQSFSVVYNFVQTGFHPSGAVWLVVLVVVVAAIVLLDRTGRLGLSLQLRRPARTAPLTTQAVVVSSTSAPQISPTPPRPAGDGVAERLDTIPGLARPQPGMTIAPKVDSSASAPTDGHTEL